jgi:periplasmic protein TonB
MAFEAILSEQRAKATGFRRAMLLFSVVLHAAALLAGLVHSVWQVDEMPMPSLEVMLTEAPPPPPPPPPPAAKKQSDSRPKTRPVEPKPHELVVPKEQPKEPPKPEPEEADAQDNGQPGGTPGGVAGGVPGGVVGGLVGSPAPPPPPTPKPTTPKLISAKLGRGQLLIDPNDERYRVKLPPPLARSGETYVAMLKVCVSAQGTVTSVQLMKGETPALDSQFPSVIGRWRYRPLIADGVATPFCYPLRYEVSGR